MKLLPPNSPLLDYHAGEVIEARLVTVPVDVDRLWNADTCPIKLLPWLALALSVDEWSTHWSESVQRNVIKASLAVHRIKGTRGAVEQALGALRASVEIIEWFESGGTGQPGTFTIDVYANEAIMGDSELLSPELYKTINRLVERTKRKSAHHTLRVGARFDNQFILAGVIAPSVGWQREHMSANYDHPGFTNTTTSAAAMQAIAVARFKMEAS